MTELNAVDLNTTDVVATIHDSLEHCLDENAESYYEGLAESADMAFLGSAVLKAEGNTFVYRDREGHQWKVTVDRIEDDPGHYHPTVSDPENGPTPADVPEQCWCSYPSADYTKFGVEGCEACEAMKSEGAGPNCGGHRG